MRQFPNESPLSLAKEYQDKIYATIYRNRAQFGVLEELERQIVRILQTRKTDYILDTVIRMKRDMQKFHLYCDFPYLRNEIRKFSCSRHLNQLSAKRTQCHVKDVIFQVFIMLELKVIRPSNSHIPIGLNLKNHMHQTLKVTFWWR